MFRCSLKKCESIIKHPEYSILFCPSCHPQLSSTVSQQVNFFHLYQLPESFRLNKSELSRKYKTMQSAVHPDILKSKGIEEHNFSKLLQESFKTLSDDLSRAKYMVSFIQLFLKGIDSEKVEINDLDYLEDQLETRGKITFAEQQELRSIQKTAESHFESLKIQLALLFDSEDYEQAKVLTAKLNFSAKILEETKERLNFL